MISGGPWPDTIERWHKEGLPENCKDDFSMADYFGLDKMGGVSFESTFGLKAEIVEETEKFIFEKDGFGATWKHWKNEKGEKNGNKTPSIIDHPVKSAADWFFFKELLKPEKKRIETAHREAYQKILREQDIFVYITPVEPMWFILEYAAGFERTLTAIHEEPELIKDMLSAYTDFILGMCEFCAEEWQIDGLWFFADLCYKNGMLFSPRTYRELLMPHHKRIAGFCRTKKWPLILHCDGDVREFIPLLMETGYNCIQPLEARCGNDVRELKKIYGTKIVFFGNISADVLGKSKEEIAYEVKTKVTAAKEGGGYLFYSDHSIPPTVSLENYKYAIKLAREFGTYKNDQS
jgi:uroporphyrinogen decarboxylase